MTHGDVPDSNVKNWTLDIFYYKDQQVDANGNCQRDQWVRNVIVNMHLVTRNVAEARGTQIARDGIWSEGYFVLSHRIRSIALYETPILLEL